MDKFIGFELFNTINTILYIKTKVFNLSEPKFLYINISQVDNHIN